MQAVNIDPGQVKNSRVFCCGDGFSYHINKHNPKLGFEVFNLRCSAYYRRRCSGTALLVRGYDGEDHWVNGQSHSTCERDFGSHPARLLRFEILEEARLHPFESSRTVIDRISVDYHPVIAARLRIQRLRHAIQRVRTEDRPIIPDSFPLLRDTLNNPQYRLITATLDGTDSVYSGTVGPLGQMSVVFVSRRILEFLPYVTDVYADGTFACTPAQPHSSQVYQIITVLRNTVIPLIVVIMERRTQRAYLAVVNHLKQICPLFMPQNIMLDFEAASVNAWSEAFPGSRVTSCYVHFANLQPFGGVDLGEDADPNIKRLLRSLLALPLLPQDAIPAAFAMLHDIAVDFNIMDDLEGEFHYFMTTWLTSWRFQTLSVFNLANRTNNACESSHRILRMETGPHHPRVWTFIDGLKRYEQHACTDIQAFRLGLNLGAPKRVVTLLNDEAIVNYTQDLLQGQISIPTFLRSASTRITNLVAQYRPGLD